MCFYHQSEPFDDKSAFQFLPLELLKAKLLRAWIKIKVGREWNMCKENNKVTKLTTFALIRCFYLTFEQVLVIFMDSMLVWLNLLFGPTKWRSYEISSVHLYVRLLVCFSVWPFVRVFFLELLLETSIFLD